MQGLNVDIHLPCLSAAREKIVGWYSTGPKIKEADLNINSLIAKFSDWAPVMVICEVQVGTGGCNSLPQMHHTYSAQPIGCDNCAGMGMWCSRVCAARQGEESV
jgi:hypothetical protein